MKDFAEHLRKIIGQKIVFICARYTYWGIISEVSDDIVVLSYPVSIEVSGSANGDTPTQVDPIPRSIYINLNAVEIAFFPKWVDDDLHPGLRT